MTETPIVPKTSFMERWMTGWRPWLLVAFLGCVLYLPFLGSVGLWDPWEPHYAEVAREMVERGDWLVPTWEVSEGQSEGGKHFFSKPALSMWLVALPMQLFGIEKETGGIVDYAAWLVRLPFALLAILGLLATFALANRFFGPKVGLLAAIILGTSPQYSFVARQAMTDMPLVALLTASLAALVIGGFDRDRERPGLIYLGYALSGLAVLGKGLSGFALPGLIFLVYFLVSGDWARLRRMRVITGGLLALLVAAPWFVYLSIVSASRKLLDDEGKTFFTRFFLHDHLYRLASGVHGDRGTFAYFIEQLGLGTHPWFAFMVYGGARSAHRLDQLDHRGREDRVELFVFIWALVGYALYSFSVTKFHHYALPAIPALAILAALWLVRWSEQPEKSRFGLLLPLGLVLIVALVSRDIGLMPKGLVDLFVYNYTRDFPKEAALPGQIGYAIIYGLTTLTLLTWLLWDRNRLRRWAAPTLAAGALAGAIFSGWYFFGAMGQHWTQKHMFETYYALRQADEPVGAYLMNWRGETFYSSNTVSQLKSNSKLKKWITKHKNKRRFILVEQHRLKKLKNQLTPEQKRDLKILDRSCNKFYLVSIDAG